MADTTARFERFCGLPANSFHRRVTTVNEFALALVLFASGRDLYAVYTPLSRGSVTMITTQSRIAPVLTSGTPHFSPFTSGSPCHVMVIGGKTTSDYSIFERRAAVHLLVFST